MSDVDDMFGLPAPLLVERLGRSLMGVPAGALRQSYLEERVRGASPLPLARALACAQREAVRGEVPARLVIDTFTLLVEQRRFDGPFAIALHASAVALGEDAVVHLLERPAANDSGPGGAQKAKRGSLAAAGETLGRRKSLARTAKGDLLVKILDDPHPDVIKNALMNPNVIEDHAVRVAARRPVPGAVLDVVAHSRFGNRAQVRRAIALNPDCPEKLGLRLIASMTRADLDDIKDAPGVLDAIRRAARLLVDEPHR